LEYEPAVVGDEEELSEHKNRVVQSETGEFYPEDSEHICKIIVYQPFSHFRFLLTSPYARSGEIPDSNAGCLNTIATILDRIGFPMLAADEKELLLEEYNLNFDFPECREETLCTIPDHQLFAHVREIRYSVL
jgi:hypothetical protein